MKELHPELASLTAELVERSRKTRAAYLDRLRRSQEQDPPRRSLSCGNLAHGYAACNADDKQTIRLMESANLGIVTAYNDMLSAHQPLEDYPRLIKQYAGERGSTAQVAGGVPAMCDGVTQGRVGMELSLFSRDTIAMATAISLTHNLFDGVLCLGVCDKIVPGLLIGALQFGHLPAGFIPAGPMPSGISNKEKARVRERYATGEASREELLDAESASYHSPGTCTFYGTANTNQMLMEVMGVQLPGCSFINPAEPMRPAMIRATVNRVIDAANKRGGGTLAEVVSEAAIVNAAVALLATGGSTNHTLHLVAIARAAGIQLCWQDLDRLSRVVPLLVRVYPNGTEDINSFQRAGGTPFLIRELLEAGLLNDQVTTLMGPGLSAYTLAPKLVDEQNIEWSESVASSSNEEVLRPASEPFSAEGGLRLLKGNLGESVIKLSAVKPEHRHVRAPCRIFHDQESMKEAFQNGELDKDCVVVVRFQGPRANGMPELHQLTPYLGVLQDRGYQVALVTDGRMSGASGKVPAAIHLAPEALAAGPIARLKDGDVIELDGESGRLNVELSEAELSNRAVVEFQHQGGDTLGRWLFQSFRDQVGVAPDGASVFDLGSGQQ
ncbi:MAG: phosphogluconate dehydratase [Gammaproteobacteria bacterium]|nr:phosphogluconate dehydratase [Pseudomonadales bacterium]MCP5348564.1 phosphogluconate dehydratase [Pseudomonadales bacterium]